MNERSIAQAIIDGRYHFRDAERLVRQGSIEAEEGGCGVTGFACSIPVSGRHIFEPSVQMHNRGNGKEAACRVGLHLISWVLINISSTEISCFKLPFSISRLSKRWNGLLNLLSHRS